MSQERYGLNKSAYFSRVQQTLKDESAVLYTLHKEVMRLTLDLPNFDSYAAYNVERNTRLEMKANATTIIQEAMSLPEAVGQYISAVFALANSNLTQITEDNPNLFFLLANGNDIIFYSLLNSAMFYMNVRLDGLGIVDGHTAFD
jgi:hypothetical protein